MKKIIALALALIMALSMASVAFAATTYKNAETVMGDVNGYFAPGAKITITNHDFSAKGSLKGYKVTTDFTTGSKGFKGASYIEDVEIAKDKNAVVVTLKESYTLTEEKGVYGLVTISKGKTDPSWSWYVNIGLNNNTEDIVGAKKASAAEIITAGDKVQIMDEEKGGYVTFTQNQLTGTVKVDAKEKAYLNFVNLETADEDSYDALMAVLGEDFEGITEMYSFETKAFDNAVDFRYDAYAEDDHFFYVWDGEKLTAIDAKYDADEDVDDYVFTADAANTIVITDVEVVLAAEEETKNPDTGANDVVGVAAALAVVSLVAAGAVSLKK